ncbi:MAG: DUF1972 domain-containing protein [Bryobacterales bacterium]|nr:DUF1972 domain-containing protein [Bryobacterales bacterium]
MRIALLGIRGIPANYGGFETFAEEIAARLVERGHQVTVYCRSHYATGARECRGARLVVLPTLRGKHTDTAVHTFLSTLHLLLRPADAAIFCNGANAVFSFWPRVAGIPTVLNVDGLERKRKKWNKAAKAWYALSERLASLCPDVVVTDSLVIQAYYRERHGLASTYIGYGAPPRNHPRTGKLAELGVEPGGYFLYVSRLEPENNALMVVQEFERSGTRRKLVVVGDAPYAASYIRKVRATRDPRIVFAGAVYGAAYGDLQARCHAYVHATEVGGTHPALVEAMGRGCAILYLDTPENAEVAARAGVVYSARPGDLASRIDEFDSAGLARMERLREAAAREAASRYDWSEVTDRYERILLAVAAGRRAVGTVGAGDRDGSRGTDS